MQKLDGRYVYSATDLNNFLECRHLVTLDRGVAEGQLTRPIDTNPTAELVARKGDEHERSRLNSYVEKFGAGVVAFDERPENSRAGLLAGETRTLEAMASGAQIIYQATFFDGEFLGRTDFLRRVDGRASPKLGTPWSYEVIDTKLALSPKPYFLIQLCNYAEHLERVQGTAPRNGYVVFGNGQERAFAMHAYGAYYRHLKASFLSWVEAGEIAYPWEIAHCNFCNWSANCERRREGDDHLSLVANARRDQIKKFNQAGITTLTELAEATRRPERMPESTFDNLRIQAQLQLAQRRAKLAGSAHPYTYRLRDPQEDDKASRPVSPGVAAPKLYTAGFAKLPEPSTADIFFDIEGDPLYRPGRGLEYLFGLYMPAEDRYHTYWARDATEEREAFENCVDFITDRLKEYPNLHVYHYASYEVTALRRLMGFFASREKAIDRFLTIGLFVDLYAAVRQAMWISQPSYSLKKVEALYGWGRETKVRGGDDSIVMFETWLATHDDAILEDIRRYNEDDCRSTYALREWLLDRRKEFNSTRTMPIPWRKAQMAPPPDEAVERTELEKRLLEGVPVPDTLDALRALPDEMRDRWLLGNVLQYHRRENKPEFWDYFHRRENVEELAEFDRHAIGGLRRCFDIPPYKKGARDRYCVYTFGYDQQEHDLEKKAACPDSESEVEIVEHDEVRRIVHVKAAEDVARSLRALIPCRPISHGRRQKPLERIASELLDGNLRNAHPATSALLRSDPPRLQGRTPGSAIQPAKVDGGTIAGTIAALCGSYLFVQGPPGSGKSTYGADAIVRLLRMNKRIALMANSHKALHNLLDKIEAAAEKVGYRFRGVHKSSSMTDGSSFKSRISNPMVTSHDKVEPDDAQLVSGTAHFWPQDNLVGRFDVICIDEAGQVSLADALTASMAARNVVLLGDPQQLPQVTQGSHPVGSARSILEHLLDGHDTVPADRGIFLDTSFRMPQSLAEFVSATSYDGRLHASDYSRGNSVNSCGLSGSGTIYLPVEHEGNGRYSEEEANRIVWEVEKLLASGTFLRGCGGPQRFEQQHIIVVAPYNLQRRKVREKLVAAGFENVAVGTVDKFQGQEAPVVFYSMATSSDDDLPRDMQFLFDKNRFNVAISRAQCLSVLVCSPRLLDARCRNPEQMELVNLLCAFAEKAATVAPLEAALSA